MSGEELHEKGREGAKRAKEWLEATTRVNVPWVNPNQYAINKLSFSWANRAPDFSFDLGGLLLGDGLNGQMFLAEVKFYLSGASDQGTLYREYLAKCYRAYVSRPERCDNFMWITWTPFLVSKWSALCSAKEVESAVVEHRERALNVTDETQAHAAIDLEACTKVADRLWLIVLSERQEQLVISKQHRGLIQQHIIAGGHL